MQMDLFDQAQRSRRSDPVTSHLGAEHIESKAANLRGEFVRLLRQLDRPATAQEIAHQAEPELRESIRKRAAECVRLGMVSECGTKRCDVTGKSAKVYWTK